MAASVARRHVILTGPPGVGKTTLIRKVIDELTKAEISTNGFYTEEIRFHGKRTGFDVVTLSGKRGTLARISQEEVTPTREYKVGQYSVNLKSFEEIALPALKNINDNTANKAVTVIDEVGKMELFSQSFVRTVKEILNEPKTTVLGTIPVPKNRAIPFVEEIRNRKDVLVYVVSRENRNNLVADIVKSLKSTLVT